MKRVILSILMILTISSFIFAQESEISVEQSSFRKESNIRLGAVMPIQAAIGDLNEFVGLHLGGGVKGEFDIPFPLPSYVKLGIGTKFQANVGFLKDDILLSMWNLQMAPSFYARFNFLDETLILQPEISYGMQLNFLTKNDEYNNKVDGMYVDQMIQFSLGLRYSPAQLANGSFEFGITPFYVLCPENGNLAQYAGAELIFMYKF